MLLVAMPAPSSFLLIAAKNVVNSFPVKKAVGFSIWRPILDVSPASFGLQFFRKLDMEKHGTYLNDTKHY